MGRPTPWGADRAAPDELDGRVRAGYASWPFRVGGAGQSCVEVASVGQRSASDLPSDLTRLHAGWRAALQMKLPMPLDRRGLEAVEQTLIQQRLVDADRPASGRAELTKEDRRRIVERILACEELPDRYRAAACLALQTGRVDLLLEGLSVTGGIRRELQQTFRPVFAYLAVVLAFAAVCSYLLAFFVSPELDRAQMDLSFPNGEAVETEGSSAWWLGLIGAFNLIGAVGCAVVSLSSGASAAIVDRSITRRYRSERLISAAADIQRQVAATEGEADGWPGTWALVSRLVGLPPEEQSSRWRGSGVSHSDGRPPASEVQDRSMPEWLLIARHHRVVSLHRLRRLRMTVPLVLCGVCAGAVVAVYATALFVPLANLLTEMSAPEVSGVSTGGPLR